MNSAKHDLPLIIRGIFESSKRTASSISRQNELFLDVENKFITEKQSHFGTNIELDNERQLRLLKEEQLKNEKQLCLIKERELQEERQLRITKERQVEKQRQLCLEKEQSLEKEKQFRLSKAREAEKEKQLRLVKEKSLEEERQLRLSIERQLEKEKQLRLVKEKSLEEERQLRLSIERQLEKERQLSTSKEQELIYKKDKIARMQNSFSWKITSPIRFLRRKFLDSTQKPASSNQNHPAEDKTYQDWIKKYDTITGDRINSYIEDFNDLAKKPLFSIIMPVFDPPKQFLEDALKSVINQVYTNWELCIADDKSTQPHVSRIIKKYSKKFSQIKVHFNVKHSHISRTSNNALKLATGDYVVLMDHDDLLRPHSLLLLAKSFNNRKNLKIVYSDEDKIDDKGIRSCPYFKPDWNPDLLLAQNYFSHLFCAERSLIKKIGGFREGLEGSQDWDLVLRLIEFVDENEIHHIPEILYHWRIHSGSVSQKINNKNYAVKAAKRAVEEHLSRLKIKAEVSVTQNQFLRIKRFTEKQVLLKASIIIPTRNNFEVLEKCIDSIIEKTSPYSFEVIVVDNQTTELDTLNYFSKIKHIDNIKVIKYEKEFNYSAINNYAAKNARNQILVFLNDDTQIISESWLEELVSQASRPEVGAVGAKLFYPNGTIQHTGIILGLGGIAGESLKGHPKEHPGQMQRANLTHNVSAVTGACLAVETKKFFKVGGFDEKNLKVAFNDVDLCLKLLRDGFKNLYTPYVKITHHESYSRGKDDDQANAARFGNEIKFMKDTWLGKIKNDPNYNINLSLEPRYQFEPKFE